MRVEVSGLDNFKPRAHTWGMAHIIHAQPRPIRLIIVHCSATPDDSNLIAGKPGTPGFRDPADHIDAWHRARGFRRDTYWRGRQNPKLVAIGYHYVIGRNGALYTGRHDHEPGAHAQGWNAYSIGICLVGEGRYTAEQWLALRDTCKALAGRYNIPVAPARLAQDDNRRRIVAPGICGHRDLPGVAKSCPCFSVSDWLAGGMEPLAGHIASAPADKEEQKHDQDREIS